MEGLNPLESMKINKNFRTDLHKVYAIGDATGKSNYAIDAIGHGRKVAEIVNHDIFKQSIGYQISEQLPEVLVRDSKTAEDFPDIPKAPRQNGAEHHIDASNRPDFSGVQVGLTAKEAAAESARCLSCGCADYYECKLLRLANIYGASTEKFPEEFHKRPKHDIDYSNFHFRRDMNKCVLCGLCVNVCGQIENDTLSAVNRGFDTTVMAAFGQPLQNRDECTLCGNCVARCPVGALTEVSPMPKHLTVREEITESTCTLCGKGCEFFVTSKAGQILRCLPAEGKTLCETGRFGFLRLGEKLLTPLVKKEGLLRRVSLPQATKTVREELNVLRASYGPQSIGIAISPTYTLEDIYTIKEYADYLNTPHIFTFTSNSSPDKTQCNTYGLKNLGISTNSEAFLAKVKSGEIKGLVVFGDELPPEIADLRETTLEFLTIQTAYTSAISTKPARVADVILPAPAFGEVLGHILNEEFNKTLPVNPSFAPACGIQTRQLIPLLTDGEVQLK
jgi:formate dehydrogenase major subunit